MSAIRNVGELASPYYLLEVWARREDVDLAAETFATLKRKVRALVRDARIFEMRQEPPDEEWLARRRELLALQGARGLNYTPYEGFPFSLSVWPDSESASAVLVGELPDFREPDERPKEALDPPSAGFELALDRFEGEADWGLLLSGLELRVYRRASGVSQQYLALDLDGLAELDDEAHWRAFAGIFRGPAFLSQDGEPPLIRRVVDESRRHATALAEDMRRDLVLAAEALIQAVLDHPANRDLLGDPNKHTLQELFEQTLYYLYRILFILFAEARDVLPLSGAGAYATTYSIDHLVELARSESDRADGTYYHGTLQRLFDLMWQGPPEVSQILGLEPVGGELFDPARTPLLDRCLISDPACRKALRAVAVGAPGSPRSKLGRRSSFAELGVDQLGSIYEGLLVLEPYLAPGPRIVVRIDGERRVLEPGSEDGLPIERELRAGDFVLESASGRRKGSGSFYTPVEITEYLANAALGPLVDPLVAEAAEDPRAAEAKLLDLNVCDPAMGSGAFLVQAGRVLALALARIRAAPEGGRVTPAMIGRAKRAVVRRCLYGIDLNPLAVALAKVSLWLETLEKGQPLSFLDAHLRCGDSLVGMDLRAPEGHPHFLAGIDVTEWPKDAVLGLKTYLRNEAGDTGLSVLRRLEERRAPKRRQAPKAQPPLPGVLESDFDAALESLAEERDALVNIRADEDSLQLELDLALRFRELEVSEESLRNRLREAAHFWCAQWFWPGEDAPPDERGAVVPPGPFEYDEIIRALLRGKPVRKQLEPVLAAAQHVTEERKFFHWALEFPEVVLDRGGFDAVIGNPPWNTLSPDVKEFFSTYDPHTFRKGVPKTRQDRRKAELRQQRDIDAAWRREARYLYQLAHYCKPQAGHYLWYAPDGQLRKGDANVFRQFVERAYRLLRDGGRLAQVLPDSVYVSSPATGVRQHLVRDGRLERCYVFENRRHIFPIDSRIKVVLLTAEKGAGPTWRFRAAFFVGKDPAGEDRAISLEELPTVLAQLDREAPELSLEEVRALAPETWAFPELQSALDAQIALHCAANQPALNLDQRGWGLTYCRELDADKDAWRFKEAAHLEAKGARRDGLRWVEPDGTEWWPLVEGTLFYHLEFPQEGKEPQKWVNAPEVRAIEARQNPDASSVMEHYRVAWRDVASATNERSSIACVLPPRTAAKDKAPTVWGGSLEPQALLALSAMMSSMPFDYLVRSRGATSLKYGILNSVPAIPFDYLRSIVRPAAEVICSAGSEFDDLWHSLYPGEPPPRLGHWQMGERRAEIDARVAIAYGHSLQQFLAVLCSFPILDRIQVMLPGEPKSFVTRDMALLTYCRLQSMGPPSITELLREIRVKLPRPRPEYENVAARVAAYRELGAIPYRPTPRGGRPPTDPALLDDILALLSTDARSPDEVAEALEEDPAAVRKALDSMVRDGGAFAEGRGKARRYYVIPED